MQYETERMKWLEEEKKKLERRNRVAENSLNPAESESKTIDQNVAENADDIEIQRQDVAVETELKNDENGMDSDDSSSSGLLEFEAKEETKAEETDKLELETLDKPKKSDEEENDESEIIEEEEGKALTWVERLYSTFVESLSTVDLVTDMLVLIQLYNGEHIWWTSLMVLMIISPYLVSFSVLGTLFQKKLKRTLLSTNNIVFKFICLILMTPVSLGYFIFIDICFMVFVIISAVILVLFRKDISRTLDRFSFEKILSLNRMVCDSVFAYVFLAHILQIVTQLAHN